MSSKYQYCSLYCECKGKSGAVNHMEEGSLGSVLCSASRVPGSVTKERIDAGSQHTLVLPIHEYSMPSF